MASHKVLAFVGAMCIGGVAVAGLSLRHEAARKVKLDEKKRGRIAVEPGELAGWIIDGRRDFVIVDLRPGAAYDQAHIGDAVHCGSCHEDKAQGRKAAQEHFVDLSKKLVVYTATGTETVELPKILAQNPRLYFLDGGWQAWQAQVLAPVVFGGETDPAQLDEKRRREAVRAFFAGERGGAVQPAQLPVTPIRRDNAHKTAGPSEGC